MFKELLKFMKHDKLIAQDEMPAAENVENEDVEVVTVILELFNFLLLYHPF